MKTIFAALTGFLLLVSPLTAEVFTDADWDRVDTILILMQTDRYQYEAMILKKAHRRLILTSIKTEKDFCWMFDANTKKAYIGNSRDGLYWTMTDVENLIQRTPESTQIIRGQLTLIESIVAMVNSKDTP